MIGRIKSFVFWSLVFIIAICSCSILCAQYAFFNQKDKSIRKVLKTSMDHYIRVKIDTVTGRPLADRDARDVDDDSDTLEYNTYSETVSYVLLRLVCSAKVFPSDSLRYKTLFERVWKWAHDSLQRINIPGVYFRANGAKYGIKRIWLSRSTINDVDDYKGLRASINDHLFAWRYYSNIGPYGGGVICSDSMDSRKLWLDGLDAASDADQDIAMALLMAHDLWGDGEAPFDYSSQAKSIISDIWIKEVKYINPMSIDIAEWYHYMTKHVAQDEYVHVSYTDNADGKHMIIDYNVSFDSSNYSGVSKILSVGGVNVSSVDKIRIKYRYTPKNDAYDRIQVQIKRIDNSVSYYMLPLARYVVDSVDVVLQGQLSVPVREIVIQIEDSLICSKKREGSLEIFSIQIISESTKDATVKPYLMAGDKYGLINGMNPSYFRPSYYGRFFRTAYPAGSWDSLKATSYEVLLADMVDLHYIDEARQVITVNGDKRIPANWLSMCILGQLGDNEWLRNDFLSGWDGFRTYFWIAQDYKWTMNAKAEEYLSPSQGPYSFLLSEATSNNLLHLGHRVDGAEFRGRYYDANIKEDTNAVLLSDTLDIEHWGSYGSYLAFFCAQNLRNAVTQMIYAKLDSMYDQTGFWRPIPAEERNKHELDPDSLDYFGQNWAWFGLAFCDSCCDVRANAAPDFPADLRLDSNYPNPVTGSMTLFYSVNKANHIVLSIYDLMGCEIDRFIDQQLQPGAFSITVDLSRYPAGSYILQIRSGTKAISKSITIVH